MWIAVDSAPRSIDLNECSDMILSCHRPPLSAQGKKVQPEQKDMVTVYFSDIVGFTKISSKMSSSKVSDMLDRLYTKFDALADEYGVFKLETIGDGRPAGQSSRSAH